jgi:DNA-binding beta-propeller fold protein YncE
MDAFGRQFVATTVGLLSFVTLAHFAASAGQPDTFLWQTNSEGTDIHVFRLRDFQLTHRLEVGPQPHGIAAPDDGRVVYVTVEANGRPAGELLWIDPKRLTIEHRLPVGPEPHALATTPDGKWVYVPCRDGNYWVVDGEARQVVKKIHTGGRPHNTQASRDGRFMYLSPMGDPQAVTVVDVPAGHVVVGRIAFGDSVRPSALSADGRLLLHQIDGLNGFQAADTQGTVTATVRHSTTLGWFRPISRVGYLTRNGFKRCHGLAIRPDQREVWSTCAEYLAIHRLEAPAFPEAAIIELAGKGYWLTFSPDSRYGFVALSDRDQVAVVRATDRRVVRYLDAGKAPKRNLVLLQYAH